MLSKCYKKSFFVGYVSLKGLPESSFLYFISTNFPGVKIAEWMMKDYPNDMTVVIQNWFENLHVDDKGFQM